jgi:hypothetical protein
MPTIDYRGIIEIDYNIVSAKEIYRDYGYALNKYSALVDQVSDSENPKLEDTKSLQKEAKKIFEYVNQHFDDHADYSYLDVSYAELPEDRGGRTLFISVFDFRRFKFALKSKIYINTNLRGEPWAIPVALAHEATHAALYNDVEWLANLVALDVAYRLVDEGYSPSPEIDIYNELGLQAVTAMSMKLRSEGKDEIQIAEYLYDKLFIPPKMITEFAYVKLKNNKFESIGKSIGKDNIVNKSIEYYGKPYFVAKMLKRTNEQLEYIHNNGIKFPIELKYLLAHTDDAFKNSYFFVDGNG